MAGQTTPSSINWLRTDSPSWVDISNTRSYEMQMPCWNRASISCRFLVFAYKRRPT
jgi:hypothetical protein